MPHEVVMPQLGLSMESGRIVRWLVNPGESVRPGDVLLEVESDKATIEVEAVAAGKLQIVVEADSDEVPVGSVIAYILAPNEAPAAHPASADRPAAGPASPAGAAPAGGPASAVGVAPAGGSGTQLIPPAQRPPSSPAARRRAAELGVDWRQAQGTGPHGRIKERDVARLAATSSVQPAPAAVLAPSPDVRMSPVARQLADSLGVSTERLAELYPGKRIERADVEQAVRQAIGGQNVHPAQPASAARATTPGGRRRPMGGLRRVIAERMTQSVRTAAPVTVTTEVDATELVRLREVLKAEAAAHPASAPAPSYNAIFARLVAVALLEHPDLNATLEGGEIVNWEACHIGIAVETERGLVVPVLRDVQSKPLQALAAEAEDLLARARAGKALPDELTGSTFTITNLGGYGVDAFTPIINPPECAVLGIGRLVRKPAVLEDGTVAPRTLLALSLTFDHRLVDGAPAARFLQRLAQFIAQPYLWLARAA